ncbi:hypothetical protein SELR_pSRC300200 (plasmid) [Selenomonas ruminantium subsp. lactilytica TAM6421]|uniref:DUF4352 domain-containing protein n=1 Tax=Selenomonas ruminantium subsp. lactilytica (strain NBRC 103574 / TAM6421) TaxID=927704 RepID=I0GWF6_SELRL|nr:DUF4352 domain-containing protein [Selenomonas ruminantium]BAL85093.1 hypothetical protein SELR_pSRC300200 [Selenomonas ruminantium subsp. lactilytica TAM6421]
MSLKNTLATMVSIAAIFALVGCGGPKTVQNQQVTLSLTYGDRAGVYTGEVNEQNIPNGKGKFETKNSAGQTWVYEGTFKDGHFDGQGKTTWQGINQSEEGTYSNDRLNGQGKRTFSVNGKPETYEGNFVSGIPMKAETVGLNTDVSYADWTYKVTAVKTQKSAGNKQASGQFLILTMDTQNNGQQTRQPGSGNFYVLADTSNGRIYKMDNDAPAQIRITTKNFNNPWYLSDVNPGNKANGILIVFDIPDDVNVNNLVLIPNQSQTKGDVTPIKLQM